MTPADEELVQSTLSGDVESFSRLYDRYAGIVRAIAFETTGNVTDAQDLPRMFFCGRSKSCRASVTRPALGRG